MCKKEITFDQLPEAVSFLIDEVTAIRSLVEQDRKVESKRVLLGIDEACLIIKKAKPTVYALVSQGKLPSLKNGKKLYFYEDELIAWIEGGRKKTCAELKSQIEAEMQQGIRRRPRSLNL